MKVAIDTVFPYEINLIVETATLWTFHKTLALIFQLIVVRLWVCWDWSYDIMAFSTFKKLFDRCELNTVWTAEALWF